MQRHSILGFISFFALLSFLLSLDHLWLFLPSRPTMGATSLKHEPYNSLNSTAPGWGTLNTLFVWARQNRYRLLTTSWVEKQKLESVENIPAFLRRSDIGQFVTRDEHISPWCHRGGSKSRLVCSSMNYELLAYPKGLIKSIDVFEAIRCLG